MKIKWNSKEINKTFEFKILNEMPIELINLIENFTKRKTEWYTIKYNINKDIVEEIYCELILIAMENISTYNIKKSSYHTYLNTIYNNFLFHIINSHDRPKEREIMGLGRIDYNTDTLNDMDENSKLIYNNCNNEEEDNK